jgi:hypothetical protein
MKREGTLEPRTVSKSATHWRARAEEVRTIAEGANDPAVSAILIGIADSYSGLALRADESAALDTKLEAAHREAPAASPIRRRLENGVFDHEMIALLRHALDGVVAELDLHATAERERAARAIVELANGRSGIDAEKLQGDAARLLRARA